MEIFIYFDFICYKESYYDDNFITAVITTIFGIKRHEEIIRLYKDYLYNRHVYQNSKFSKIKFYCSP
jgi:hypothetical protein